MRRFVTALALFASPASAASAQNYHEGTEQVASEEAAIQQSIDGVYAAISGPVGKPRAWDAMRALMTDDARLTPIGMDGHHSHDIGSYIERSEEFLVGQGFFEIETGNRIEIFGNLAQVWSAYEGRTGSANGPVFVTGINGFQLVRTGDGWKVFSILWQAANEDLPVPADLAANDGKESD